MQSKVPSGGFLSKMKNNTALKSTLIHTGAQNQSFFMQSHPSNDINIGLTESIVLEDKKPATGAKNRKTVKNLRQIIDDKKKVL